MAAEANKPRKPLTIRLSYKYPCDARVSAQQELKLKFTSDVEAHGCYCVELCVGENEVQHEQRKQLVTSGVK